MGEGMGLPIDIVQSARDAHARFADSREQDNLGTIIGRAIFAERQRVLALIEEIRVSPHWSGDAADALCEVISGEVQEGRLPLNQSPLDSGGSR